jgi:hypothetical protein
MFRGQTPGREESRDARPRFRGRGGISTGYQFLRQDGFRLVPHLGGRTLMARGFELRSCWQGRVDEVIAELTDWLAGQPPLPDNIPDDDLREVVRRSMVTRTATALRQTPNVSPRAVASPLPGDVSHVLRDEVVLEGRSPQDFPRVSHDSVGDQEELIQWGQGEDQARH